MPWVETSPMNTRPHFVADNRLGRYSRAELCARYGISRKAGYQWRARYHQKGLPGLHDRGHAPHHCP